jgi:hypothetical protein
MAEPPTAQWVTWLRTHNYRRTPQRRLQSRDEAIDFVNEMGFAFFWPIKGIECANLFHAIAGRARAVPHQHDDPDIEKCWGWKDQLLGARVWFYAKVLRRRATLISLNLLPAFYALSPNYGDYESDYLEEYMSGEVTAEAKNIYEALLEQGPLDTIHLRRAAGLAAVSAKSRFGRALVELQVELKVLPIGVAPEGAWHYAFIYEIVSRHYPHLPERAHALTRAQAREALIRRYVDSSVAVTRRQISQLFHVFKWAPREMDRALSTLEEEGAILQMPVEGIEGMQLVSGRALEMLATGTPWSTSAGPTF